MKKVIAVLGIVAFSIVLFTNTNNVTSSGDLDLASLAALNEADAECVPSQPWSASGKCLTLSQICVFAVTYRDCDPYKM